MGRWMSASRGPLNRAAKAYGSLGGAAGVPWYLVHFVGGNQVGTLELEGRGDEGDSRQKVR